MQNRRIAHWQSTSEYIEGAAAFESCSAYQNSKHVLFLSSCVPNPPDKGERIRAHHVLNRLAAKYPVHLVCFASDPSEIEAALALKDRCASVWVEYRPKVRRLMYASLRFAMGFSLTLGYFDSRPLRRQIAKLRQHPLGAVVSFSSALAQHAPADTPLILDMVDVDSEKWRQYSELRFPGWAYHIEYKRLRRKETEFARRARKTFLAARQETELLGSFVSDAAMECIENGVDFEYFNPDAVPPQPSFDSNSIVFLGAMDYYPNVQAVTWFAEHVLPALRRSVRHIEFWIVGRNPTKQVLALRSIPGVCVTGTVPDVRPYISASRAVVAPLPIARGIQNKVLEAIAMGRPVLVSPAVARTFGGEAPEGMTECATPQDYINSILNLHSDGPDWSGRAAAAKRFSWSRNLTSLLDEVERAIAGPPTPGFGSVTTQGA
jgi:sugar transferase (PEP-CTERM/EpsH1 system associated)